jgi:hypothetical protein
LAKANVENQYFKNRAVALHATKLPDFFVPWNEITGF